jgi:HK97 family phage major capsid protein
MIDITSWLTELVGEGQGQELDNQVLNGSGSPFDGILLDANVNEVVMASGDTNFADITGDYLSKMISKLSVNKLANAKFVMHRTVLHYLRIVKAGTASGYQWANMAAGEPASVWGYPYLISEKAPAATDSTAETDVSFVAFGNFKNYAIGQRLMNTTLDIDPFTYFSTYRTQFRLVSRFGMAMGLPLGFCKLTTK